MRSLQYPRVITPLFLIIQVTQTMFSYVMN